MLVLTGATGTVGSAVMSRLSQDGVRARALAHTPRSRAAIESSGHEAVDGDLDDAAGLVPAFEGCDRLFLLSPAHPDQVRREKAAIDAARRAGVSHVVALSVMGADAGSASAFGRWHAEIDEHLASSGMDHTILRGAGFVQTHLWPVAPVRDDGRWYGMTGDGAAAFVDAHDVAAAAAGALTVDTPPGSVVELTGPAAISMPQAAAQLSAVIGRPVTYVDVPAEDYRSSLHGAGVPDWMAEAIVGIYSQIRAGHAATVTDGVQRLSGSLARSYREFAEEHRGDFADGQG